jgi:hypothetical protein
MQTFFTYRVYIVSHGRLTLCIPLWFLEFGNVGLTCVTAFLAYKSSSFLAFQAEWTSLVYIMLIIAAVVRQFLWRVAIRNLLTINPQIDIGNTAGLCWYLRANSYGLHEYDQLHHLPIGKLT